MTEILLLTDNGPFVREINDHDLYNMFPQRSYTERPATREDVERLMSQDE